jgi:phosphatidylinositol phospholipase C beta
MMFSYFYVSFSSRFQDTGSGTPITLRVDKQGFYLYWFDQNHEMDLLDIATIRDVRTGQYAKKPKVCMSALLFIQRSSKCVVFVCDEFDSVPRNPRR